MEIKLLNKVHLRNEMLKARDKLVEQEVQTNSKLICAKLIELEGIHKAKTIMGFSAIGNEVSLLPWLEEERLNGKTVLLPRVENQGAMHAIEYQGVQATKSGPFGIREPLGIPFDIEKIDAVIVPGLTFDYKGYRIGYGKGYYDRFLKSLSPKTFICGVCYEFQIVESIDTHENDVAVDWIVTEHSELVIKWEHF